MKNVKKLLSRIKLEDARYVVNNFVIIVSKKGCPNCEENFGGSKFIIRMKNRKYLIINYHPFEKIMKSSKKRLEQQLSIYEKQMQILQDNQNKIQKIDDEENNEIRVENLIYLLRQRCGLIKQLKKC